jgi:photosystem II stability/assembly factor-like uncharacterized protein
VLLLPITAGLLAACSPGTQQNERTWTLDPVLTPQQSGTGANFIGISAVDQNIVWVSGGRGTWARTTDGGATWQAGQVPDADSLQFRDVHAVDAATAYLLSIGPGDASRIYKTTDSGASWTLQFMNMEPNAFFDCFGFWDPTHGIAMSDSYDGTFPIIRTDDGLTWTRIPPAQSPAANTGEGGFASSGTCLITQGDSTAWIGSGASPGGARVIRTGDRGQSWSAAETPIIKSPSAGITSLSFRSALDGLAVGGDIAAADAFTDNVAVTHDGGLTWSLAARTPFPGAAYGSSAVPGAPSPAWVTVGPNGLAFSVDDAATWTPLDTLNHWGVAFVAPDAGWAVGPNGRITRIRLFAGS